MCRDKKLDIRLWPLLLCLVLWDELSMYSKIIKWMIPYVTGATNRNHWPFSALSRFSGPLNPCTLAGVSMWDKSAATPGVCTISYKLSSVTSGLCFSKSDKGWPIPPAAPQTATFTLFCLAKEWNSFRIKYWKVQSSFLTRQCTQKHCKLFRLSCKIH